jgi:hypothetical protein
MIAESLLATLHGFKGPPREEIAFFEKIIRKLRDDARDSLDEWIEEK